MSLPPPQLPPPTPPSPPATGPHVSTGLSKRGKRILIGVAVAAVALVAITNAVAGKDPDPAPSGGDQELCELLRSSEYRSFEADDWRRLADMADYELRRYVADRCPDQLDRV
jgi:hypothetical protein